ncbi:hypothetical protein FIA58_017765 [Flavobacterium jejuense]|uniref:Auto-transporter adhesin head GIN domain-containing protein n=1 Tax=Flavobacterium jejuense TaxID=1544455 RepID=A0ABX0IUE3_9FLAO|nr:hypothetical protein [Flavobacterium jejuense]NHN27530.1 hypothetical protein [Flavobacterium jejuense]
MRKNYMLLLTMLLVSITVYSQDIDFKKGKILADHKNIFNFDKRKMGSEISIFKLDTTTEVIYIEINNNNTISFLNDDYVRMVFPKNDVTIESTLLINKNFKEIIQLLFMNNVIDFDGNINAENLELFRQRQNNRKI